MNNVGFHHEYDDQFVFNAGRWSFKINKQTLSQHLNAAAIKAAVAGAILSSAYLAYVNPRAWWTTYAAVGVVNLYLLPKILHYGNADMIRLAFIANLTSLSTLSLGGIGIKALSLAKSAVSGMVSSQFSSSLVSAFYATALIGYGIPLFSEGLMKAHRFLYEPGVWQENLVHLENQFKRLPEMGLGLLQTHLWKNFILNLALISPSLVLPCPEDEFPFWLIWRRFVSSSDYNYIWSMAVASSEKVTPDQFRKLLNEMAVVNELVRIQEAWPAEERDNLPEGRRENFHSRLKIWLRCCFNKKDLSEAIFCLLSDGSKLIPRVISNKQFLDLFVNDALQATNEEINKFLDSIKPWEGLKKKHEDLTADVLAFEQELQTQNNLELLPADEIAAILQRKAKIDADFNSLGKEVNKIYMNSRIWKDFAPLWNEADKLPFENAASLLAILHNQVLLQEINGLYRSMFQKGEDQKQTLVDSRENINNKIRHLENIDKKEKAPSALKFLCANKGFRTNETDQLQELFNLESPHQLKKAMVGIGLVNEEDLYSKNILQKNKNLSTELILDNLRRYIQKCLKPKTMVERFKQIGSAGPTSPLHLTGEKVSRAVYYATTSGLILVPMLINLSIGMAGFGLGLGFFTLKRFNVPGTAQISQYVNELIPTLPLGTLMKEIVTRNAFSADLERREEADAFVKADFFERIRIINYHIIPPIFASFFVWEYALSFSQGLSAANEVVSLI